MRTSFVFDGVTFYVVDAIDVSKVNFSDSTNGLWRCVISSQNGIAHSIKAKTHEEAQAKASDLVRKLAKDGDQIALTYELIGNPVEIVGDAIPYSQVIFFAEYHVGEDLVWYCFYT